MNMLVQSFESWDAHLYTRLTTLKCLVYVQKQAAAFSFGHTLFEKGNSIFWNSKIFWQIKSVGQV